MRPATLPPGAYVRAHVSSLKSTTALAYIHMRRVGQQLPHCPGHTPHYTSSRVTRNGRKLRRTHQGRIGFSRGTTDMLRLLVLLLLLLLLLQLALSLPPLCASEAVGPAPPREERARGFPFALPFAFALPRRLPGTATAATAASASSPAASASSSASVLTLWGAGPPRSYAQGAWHPAASRPRKGALSEHAFFVGCTPRPWNTKT